MKKIKLATPLVAVALLAGAGAGIASFASAQSLPPTTPTTTVQSSIVTTTDTGSPTVKKHTHAPLGGDGNITSINGTTIVMAEESDEGGASYTIDASKATITKDGTASTLSALIVGDKIFVQGTTTGTNIVATNVSSGKHGRGHGPETSETKTASGQ